MAKKSDRPSPLEVWRQKLGQAIKDRGKTFEEVSEGAGKNPEYVSRCVNGRANPTVGVLQAICAHAGIDFIWLFTDEETVLASEIAEKASIMSDDEARLIARIVASSRN